MPMPRQISTVGTKPRPLCTISAAEPVETRPTTEPTDRSMSPSRMIMVMPMARMPVSDTARSRFMMLVTLRNMLRPLRTHTSEPMMNRAISAM